MATRVDTTLSRHAFLAGPQLSEADILCFGFFAQIDNYLLGAAGFGSLAPSLRSFPHLSRWIGDVARSTDSLRECVLRWPAHIAAFAAADAGRPNDVRVVESLPL